MVSGNSLVCSSHDWLTVVPWDRTFSYWWYNAYSVILWSHNLYWNRGATINGFVWHHDKINTTTAPSIQSQRTHDARITLSWRQNDVETSFWRNYNVIIAPCARWELSPSLISLNDMLQWNSVTYSTNIPRTKWSPFRRRCFQENEVCSWGLVQIMAGRPIGYQTLSEPMVTQFTDAYIQHKGNMS